MDHALLIAVVAVFLVSIIFSMFGQGGGSLCTPILFLIGYSALVSISTSLVLNLITAFSAAIVYYRANLIDIRLAVVFIPGICIGASLGARYMVGIQPRYIKPGFGIILWAFAVQLVLNLLGFI